MVDTTGLHDVPLKKCEADAVSLKTAMNLILGHQDRLSVNERWVMLWLIYQTQLKQWLEASSRDVAPLLGISDRSFIAQVTKLEGKGFLLIKKQKRGCPQRYWVDIQNMEVK